MFHIKKTTVALWQLFETKEFLEVIIRTEFAYTIELSENDKSFFN